MRMKDRLRTETAVFRGLFLTFGILMLLVIVAGILIPLGVSPVAWHIAQIGTYLLVGLTVLIVILAILWLGR